MRRIVPVLFAVACGCASSAPGPTPAARPAVTAAARAPDVAAATTRAPDSSAGVDPRFPLPAGARARLGAAACHVQTTWRGELRFVDGDRLLIVDSRMARVVDARTCVASSVLALDAAVPSPSGRRLLITTDAGALEVVDLAGRVLRTITESSQGLSPVLRGVADDGTVIAGLSDRPCVRVWRDGKGPRDLCRSDLASPRELDQVVASPDGTRVVTFGDKTAVLFRTEDGGEAARWTTSRTSARFATGAHVIDGANVRGWDGQRLGTVPRTWFAATVDLVFGVRTAGAGWIEVTTREGAARARLPFGSGDGKRAVAIAPGGGLVAILEDEVVRVYDATDGSEQTPPSPSEGRSGVHASFARDGKSVVTSTRAGIQRWDAETGELVESLTGAARGTFSIGVLQRDDGRWVWVAMDPDGIANVWLQTDAKPVAIRLGDLGWSADSLRQTAALSPDGDTVVAIEAHPEWAGLVVVDLVTRKSHKVRLATGESPTVPWIAFTPDGKALVAVVAGSQQDATPWYGLVLSTQSWKLTRKIPMADDEGSPWMSLDVAGTHLRVGWSEAELATGATREVSTTAIASTDGAVLHQITVDDEAGDWNEYWIETDAGAKPPRQARRAPVGYRPIAFTAAGAMLACDVADCILVDVPVAR